MRPVRREDMRPMCDICARFQAAAVAVFDLSPDLQAPFYPSRRRDDPTRRALCGICLMYCQDAKRITRIARWLSQRCHGYNERRTRGRTYVNARWQCPQWTAHPSGYCRRHRPLREDSLVTWASHRGFLRYEKS